MNKNNILLSLEILLGLSLIFAFFYPLFLFTAFFSFVLLAVMKGFNTQKEENPTLAMISHELKTPITVIQGYVDLLLDKQLSEDQKNIALEKILISSLRLNRMIDSLLKLQEIDYTQELKMGEHSLDSLLQEIHSDFLLKNPGSYLRIDNSTNLQKMVMEKDLLKIAIMNLLENGVKFSPFPASLCLKIVENSDKIVISIQDQGIGIPLSEIDKIFDRFYSVDKATSRKLGGVGLGLFIVKKIVEKHKGTISVNSEINKGSCFTLSFPKS